MTRKRRLRKVMALALGVMLLFSQMSISVFGEDNISVIQTEMQEESVLTEDTVKQVEDLEIMKPDEQTDKSGNGEESLVLEELEQIEARDIVYDSQPTTKEEAQEAIGSYNKAYQDALASGGFLAALNVAKPHWEYEVASNLMPFGWHCELVNWDADFGEDYYTFFPDPMAMSSITLLTPTRQGLQDLIDQEVSFGETQITVEITESFSFDETPVLIPAGIDVTIQSATAGTHGMTQSNAFVRHFVVHGSLTLQDITLDGSTAGSSATATGGGIAVQSGGEFTMSNGTVIKNCHYSYGGGVSVSGGIFNMEGGTISGNTAIVGAGVFVTDRGEFYMIGGTIGGDTSADTNVADNYGGGVCVDNSSSFVMEGGSISKNRVTGPTAGGGGGGVFLVDGSEFELHGGKICNNVATANPGWQSYGGGVMVGTLAYEVGREPARSSFTMTGGEITGNDAKYVGGGVAVLSNCSFNMTDGIISGNTAITGNGGGGVFIGRVLFSEGVVFTMSGGEITGNKGNAGGGVLVEGEYTFGLASFEMTGGEISGNTAAAYGGGVCLLFSNSSFIMGDSTGSTSAMPVIRDNKSASNGGGVYSFTGSMTLYDGVIAGNESVLLGGGVCADAGTTFIIEGGTIGGEETSDANIADTSGGGVAIKNSATNFTMNDGKITGNIAKSTAAGGGGGIYLASDVNAVMNGGSVSGNTAGNNGGGVYIMGDSDNPQRSNFIKSSGGVYMEGASSSGGNIPNRVYVDTTNGTFISNFTMNGGEISGNKAAMNGGGIYARSSAFLSVNSESSITHNSAPNGYGGGIFTEDYSDYADLNLNDYQNITIADTVMFNGNTAKAAYMPPIIAASYTNIAYRVTSIMGNDGYIHPINNYDINYDDGNPLTLHTVTYDANGGSGTAPVDSMYYISGTYVTVADKGNLGMTDYTFTGWNTDPSGGGTSYKADNTFIITGNVTLYAQWTKVPGGGGGGGGATTYKVVYHASNGLDEANVTDGGKSTGDTITVKSGTIFTAPDGKNFTGWGEKEGGAVVYQAKDTFTMPAKDVHLYAVWKSKGSESKLNKEDHFAYVIGYPEGDVRPQGHITREEVATIFFRLLTEESRNDYWKTTNRYSDMVDGRWSGNAVSTLTNAKILTGYTNGSFQPSSFITRAELASITARFDSGETTASSGVITDISGHWAEGNIKRAVELGWVEGYPDGTFRPDNYITRAEVMTLVNRVLNRQVNSTEDMLGHMAKWSDNSDVNVWYYFAVQEATNSHYYERKVDGINEKWTELRDNPDWKALEQAGFKP